MEIYYYILLESIICFILALIILLFYIRKGTNPLVFWCALLTWFLNFFMVALLPYDICLTNKLKENPNLTDSEKKTALIIKICYNIIYWLIFLYSWIIMPLLNKYEKSGEFTKWDKLLNSIRNNIILYGSLLIICIIIFIWAYIKLEKNTLSFFIYNIFNFNYIFGLSLVLILLSYSLIKLPKNLYQKINYEKTIQYYEYTAKNINDKLTVVKLELEESAYLLLSTIEDSKMMQELGEDKYWNNNKIIRENSNKKSIYKYEKYLKDKFDYLYKNAKVFDIEIKKNSFGNDKEPIRDIKKLVQLNKKIINSEWDVLRLQCQIQNLYYKWCTLKTVIILGKKNKYLSNSKYNKIGNEKVEKINNGKNDESFITLNNVSKFKVWYFLKLRKIFLFLFTIILIIFGGIIFVSEISIPFKYNLSLFGILISSVTNVMILHLVLFIQIIYLLVMSLYTLFQLKISGYYGMYSNKQTDAPSLMFFSDNLCRIVFPLCLNVIMMINHGDNNNKTILEQNFNINIQNVVFNTFNNCSPLILVICLLMNGFDVFTRVGKCFGLDDFYIESQKRDDDIEEGHDFLMSLNKKYMGKIMTSGNLQEISAINSSVNIDFTRE